MAMRLVLCGRAAYARRVASIYPDSPSESQGDFMSTKKAPIMILPDTSSPIRALTNDHTHEVRYLNRHGATITTRHYSWNSVEIEKTMLRRIGVHEVSAKAI